MPSGRGRWRPVVGLSVVVLVLLVLVARPSVAQQQPISTTEGHAQIIAQRVAALPAPDAAWRVVYHTVEPGDARPLSTDLSFTLVDQGSLLVAADEGDDRRLLGPGEGMVRAAGDAARGSALDDRPAGYYAFDLVAPEAVEVTGDGVPIYAGAPFPAPPGDRDLKLVRGVLAPADTTLISPVAAEAPLLVLATLGTVQVEPADGGVPVELRVGQAEAFTGEVTVRGAGLAPASFVVAMIGRAVEPAAGTPVASPVAAAGGRVDIRLHACPARFRPGQSNISRCPPDFAAVELTLVELLPDGGERELGPPAPAATSLEWTGLPPGDYMLRATSFGPHLDRFFVAGLPGTTGAAAEGYPAGEDGYLVPITATDPIYQLDVYAFASGDQGTPVVRTTVEAVRQDAGGSVGVRMFACPSVGLVSFDPAACAIPTGPYDISLISAALAAPVTLAEATPDANGYSTWTDLAPGNYVLQVPLMPAGTVAYFVAESARVSLLADGTGYAVSVDGAEAPLLIDVYAVGPEPPLPTLVPTPAPTVVPTLVPTAVPTAAPVDSDGDGLTDDVETATYGTDPAVWDTDGDGVGDGEEIQTGTDPFTPNTGAATGTDSDLDGLPDADEAAWGTDPFVADTDADGWLDGNEVLLGSEPLNPNSFPRSP